MSFPTDAAPCNASIAPTGYVPHMRCASMRRQTEEEEGSLQHRHAHPSVANRPVATAASAAAATARIAARAERSPPAGTDSGGAASVASAASAEAAAAFASNAASFFESFESLSLLDFFGTATPPSPGPECPSREGTASSLAPPPPRALFAPSPPRSASSAEDSFSLGFDSSFLSEPAFSAPWCLAPPCAWWSPSRPCLPARPRGCTAGGTNPSSRRSTSLSASFSAALKRALFRIGSRAFSA
mmetsp:Transcript_1751/g.7047  ORF Transcript_1751/g.7047 Transcript_1751/m.7047 type:complete len:243 (+) Transcript_1751:463-1191(+)